LKRRITILSGTVLVCFLIIMWFMMGGRGNTASCEREIGVSVRFEEEDISQAMDVVEETFTSEFRGCYLIRLTYEEAISDRYRDEYAEIYGAENALILTSVFDVGPSGGDGSLNPNSTYSNWQWVLTRSADEPWALQTWGY